MTAASLKANRTYAPSLARKQLLSGVRRSPVGKCGVANGEEARRRAEELATGEATEASTAESLAVAQRRLEQAQERTRSAHRRAGDAHEKAAAVHDRAAADNVGDVEAHEKAAVEHRVARDADYRAAEGDTA